MNPLSTEEDDEGKVGIRIEMWSGGKEQKGSKCRSTPQSQTCEQVGSLSCAFAVYGDSLSMVGSSTRPYSTSVLRLDAWSPDPPIHSRLQAFPRLTCSANVALARWLGVLAISWRHVLRDCVGVALGILLHDGLTVIFTARSARSGYLTFLHPALVLLVRLLSVCSL